MLIIKASCFHRIIEVPCAGSTEKECCYPEKYQELGVTLNKRKNHELWPLYIAQ